MRTTHGSSGRMWQRCGGVTSVALPVFCFILATIVAFLAKRTLRSS